MCIKYFCVCMDYGRMQTFTIEDKRSSRIFALIITLGNGEGGGGTVPLLPPPPRLIRL